MNAAWKCKSASNLEIENYRLQKNCPAPNMKYVDCEPPEPITCRVIILSFEYHILFLCMNQLKTIENVLTTFKAVSPIQVCSFYELARKLEMDGKKKVNTKWLTKKQKFWQKNVEIATEKKKFYLRFVLEIDLNGMLKFFLPRTIYFTSRLLHVAEFAKPASILAQNVHAGLCVQGRFRTRIDNKKMYQTEWMSVSSRWFQLFWRWSNPSRL